MSSRGSPTASSRSTTASRSPRAPSTPSRPTRRSSRRTSASERRPRSERYGGGPLLELEGINTYYGAIHILQDVNLAVREGELVCLLGGNASGKSTTLKTILGIVRPRTGAVRFAGE